MSPLKSKSRGVCKWLPICSQFVPVMRSRPSFPMDEIINSWGQTAWSSLGFMAHGERSLQPRLSMVALIVV